MVPCFSFAHGGVPQETAALPTELWAHGVDPGGLEPPTHCFVSNSVANRRGAFFPCPALHQADALPTELQSHEVAQEGFEPSTFRLVSNSVMKPENCCFFALILSILSYVKPKVNI